LVSRCTAFRQCGLCPNLVDRFEVGEQFCNCRSNKAELANFCSTSGGQTAGKQLEPLGCPSCQAFARGIIFTAG